MACYHGAASTCRGKFFVPFGASLGICLSQTRASHNKPDGFSRERSTFGDEMISIASYFFQKISRVNIEQQECCAIFWVFRGSRGHFYTLTEFSMHSCAQFKFELHAHAPVHISGLKNQMCVLGCNLRSHARNRNECQTPLPPSLAR